MLTLYILLPLFYLITQVLLPLPPKNILIHLFFVSIASTLTLVTIVCHLDPYNEHPNDLLDPLSFLLSTPFSISYSKRPFLIQIWLLSLSYYLSILFHCYNKVQNFSKAYKVLNSLTTIFSPVLSHAILLTSLILLRTHIICFIYPITTCL